jgi:hypothetical protein
MDEKRTYYELTSGQNILLLSQKFSLLKQVNNVHTLMLVDKELDFAVLERRLKRPMS